MPLNARGGGIIGSSSSTRSTSAHANPTSRAAICGHHSVQPFIPLKGFQEAQDWCRYYWPEPAATTTCEVGEHHSKPTTISPAKASKPHYSCPKGNQLCKLYAELRAGGRGLAEDVCSCIETRQTVTVIVPASTTHSSSRHSSSTLHSTSSFVRSTAKASSTGSAHSTRPTTTSSGISSASSLPSSSSASSSTSLALISPSLSLSTPSIIPSPTLSLSTTSSNTPAPQPTCALITPYPDGTTCGKAGPPLYPTKPFQDVGVVQFLDDCANACASADDCRLLTYTRAQPADYAGECVLYFEDFEPADDQGSSALYYDAECFACHGGGGGGGGGSEPSVVVPSPTISVSLSAGATATSVCTQATPAPDGEVCGKEGPPLYPTFTFQDAGPKADVDDCASACANAAGCVLFEYMPVNPVVTVSDCVLYFEDIDVADDPQSGNFYYDLGCFDCVLDQ